MIIINKFSKRLYNQTGSIFIKSIKKYYTSITNQIQLTKEFKTALQSKLIKKDINNFLRLQILAGQGCEGFTYKFKFDSKIQSSDMVYQQQRKVTNQDNNIISLKTVAFAVNGTDLKLLKGATLDYSQQMMRQMFYVKQNPNAQLSCGCKTSFSPKEYLL